MDARTQHTVLPVVIAQVSDGAFRTLARWDDVAPDPYLLPARRLPGAGPAGAFGGVMKRRLLIPDLGGAEAAILHRPHPTVQALSRQLGAIGLAVTAHWPDLGPGALAADYTFFDADMGYDAQFPWAPGAAPMPMIALIGSEAPGRIEWALAQGADAQLLKPVGDHGVFGALLIARNGFEARRTPRRGDRRPAQPPRRAPDRGARGDAARRPRPQRGRGLRPPAPDRHGLAGDHRSRPPGASSRT